MRESENSQLLSLLQLLKSVMYGEPGQGVSEECLPRVYETLSSRPSLIMNKAKTRQATKTEEEDLGTKQLSHPVRWMLNYFSCFIFQLTKIN